MPIAFETFDFSGYDLVISITSEAAKGIITRPETLHICYCLTPTRYLWSHYDEYFKGKGFRSLTKPVVKYLRAWDKISARRPDVLVGISTTVQERIKKYYGRESELIYPPVDVQKFEVRKGANNLLSTSELEANSNPKTLDLKDYYLIVSRLVGYKKVDLAVEAFNELGLPLVIVGTGSEDFKLKAESKRNIHFAGFVQDEKLPLYYQKAKALIFPQEEDFGITSVEAQAAGVPVIAFRSGGALDTVVDGKTGLFFDTQTQNSLINVIQRFESSDQKITKYACVENAKKFSKERFKKEFAKLVDKYADGDLQ
jgi:glycosyltransferase involved in cell wall biosynthesis